VANDHRRRFCYSSTAWTLEKKLAVALPDYRKSCVTASVADIGSLMIDCVDGRNSNP